jgi:hypothetical protein
MGRLAFGNESVKLDDRTLAHVEAVIVTKLRRHEPFLITWAIDPSLGSGRVSKWVHTALSWDIRFDNRRPQRLNQVWLGQLMATANSPTGLRLLPEPVDDRVE